MTDHTTRSNYGAVIPYLLAFAELGVVNLCYYLTLTVFHLDIMHQLSRTAWLTLNLLYIPLMLISRYQQNLHRSTPIENIVMHALKRAGIFLLFFIAATRFLHIDYGVWFFSTMFGILVVGLSTFTLSSNLALKSYRRLGRNYVRIVIVGTNDTAKRLTEAMQSDAGYGYRIVGYFDNNVPNDPFFKGKYLGPVDDLADYVRRGRVNEIFFTLSGNSSETLRQTMKVADDAMLRFFYVPQIPHFIKRSFDLHNLGSVPILPLLHNPLNDPLNRIIKRSFDIAFSGAFLLVFPVILIPVGIAIKMSSPGPIFFRQQRTGYKGKTFMCLKFRTMRMNKNADKVQATADDPRKTRLGNFLRHTSIDELPQFINVFKGDMSVVGPRPHMLKHTEEYTRLINEYMVRHLIKPGVTGWAQVNGYRGPTDELWKMEKRVEHDVWYIENWSFALDLKIIVRTLINAAGGEKNAF